MAPYASRQTGIWWHQGMSRSSGGVCKKDGDILKASKAMRSIQ